MNNLFFRTVVFLFLSILFYRYLGSAHRTCNLNKRREKPFLSILFHNFSGYDSHLIIPFLTKSLLPEVESVSVIPKSGEKFMALKINKRVTLLDSMNFLSGSLDNLFSSIKNSCSFKIIKQSSLLCIMNDESRKIPKHNANERLSLLTRKGFFPYQWATKFEDYSLPHLVERKEFYNTLTNSCITEEQYVTAQKMWTTFDMKMMQDYMETYCLCDVLLLSEVFEVFRSECLTNFEIEPMHFISLLGSAFQTFLKKTDVELDFITDPDLFDMLSSNLRGGHSFTSQRYEESSAFKNIVNNEAESTTELQHILYIDANNL